MESLKKKILSEDGVGRIAVIMYAFLWLFCGLAGYLQLVISFGMLLGLVCFLKYKIDGQVKVLNWKSIWAGLLYGICLIILELLFLIFITVLSHSELKSSNTDLIVRLIKQNPLMIVYVCLVAPVIEEIVFRKYLYQMILKGLKSRFKDLNEKMLVMISSVFVGILFSVAHSDNTIIVYLLMSCAFQYIYLKHKDIRPVIITHIFVNCMTALMLLLV